MISYIVFDFDGVLAESAEIKTRAFLQLFSRWPAHADEILSYHIQHAGISRYVKFRHIFLNILRIDYDDAIAGRLASEFSKMVDVAVERAPLVDGAAEFLDRGVGRYVMYIASGTPEPELRQIAKQKEIARFFRGIYGSPRGKAEILTAIVDQERVAPAQMVMVGDALSDREAASVSGVHFVLRTTAENASWAAECPIRIRDLTNLDVALRQIDS